MDEEATAAEIEVARIYLQIGGGSGSRAAVHLSVKDAVHPTSEHSVWKALAIAGTGKVAVANLLQYRGAGHGFLFTPHEMAILRALYASLLL